MRVQLKGCWETKRVWLNGKQLIAYESQQVINHSPDGFNWGYGGSGPAQLSLGIAMKLWSEKIAKGYYHRVMLIVANLPKENFNEQIDI